MEHILQILLIIFSIGFILIQMDTEKGKDMLIKDLAYINIHIGMIILNFMQIII